MRQFTFCLAGHDCTCQDLTLHTFVRKLGLSIAQNANSVEILRVFAQNGDVIDGFAKQLLSLDVWKEAFPSLQGACLTSDLFHDASDVSPHLMQHVRSVALIESSRLQMITPGYLDLIGSMIRRNVIEQVSFDPCPIWRCHTKLLDDTDTLRSVRSFVVFLPSLFALGTPLDVLVGSFERTKAEGDKLKRLSVNVPETLFSAKPVESIIRSGG